jgi:hypothetical protein
MKNEVIELSKNAETGVWELNIEALRKALVPVETANLEAGAGILGGIAQTKVFGIPIGAAAGGLLTAGAWDALSTFISGKFTQIPNWAIPAAGSWVTGKYFARFMGEGAANAASLLLAADAIQLFFNLRGMIGGLVGKGTAALTANKTAANAPSTIEEYNALMGIR